MHPAHRRPPPAASRSSNTSVRAVAPGPAFQEQFDRLATLPPLFDPGGAAAAFLRTGTACHALRFAVLLDGDTDTIAAMADARAGAHHGASAIPATWLRRLRQADRLTRLADALLVHS